MVGWNKIRRTVQTDRRKFSNNRNYYKVNSKRAIQADRLYLALAAIFIASLVAGNLIFQKFFSWDFFGIYTFEVSVGILPYPVTFLITDIISGNRIPAGDRG